MAQKPTKRSFIQNVRIMRVSMAKNEEIQQNEMTKTVRIIPYKNL